MTKSRGLVLVGRLVTRSGLLPLCATLPVYILNEIISPILPPFAILGTVLIVREQMPVVDLH